TPAEPDDRRPCRDRGAARGASAALRRGREPGAVHGRAVAAGVGRSYPERMDFLLDNMWLIWLFWTFLLGTGIGSWLNVCIARLPLQTCVLWPGSRCGTCLARIHWYDNIPLLGYLRLRGRCRACGQRFSIRYFLIEMFTGV